MELPHYLEPPQIPTQPLCLRAHKIAELIHAGQTHGDGTTPYWWHCGQVARVLEEVWPTDIALQVSGWVHDGPEDVPELFSLKDLRMAFHAELGDEPHDLVRAVTTPRSMGNRRVRLGKLIDLIHNYPPALRLKQADRLINGLCCRFYGDSRLSMYQREYPRFRAGLRHLLPLDPGVSYLWAELDRVLG